MKDPGRELDAEIAVKVMGLVPCDAWRWQYIPGAVAQLSVGGPPCYSTDIAAAWLVVEKLKKYGRVLQLTQITARDRPWWWEAEFYCVAAEGEEPKEDSLGSAPTAPHAICLAALAAIGEGNA